MLAARLIDDQTSSCFAFMLCVPFECLLYEWRTSRSRKFTSFLFGIDLDGNSAWPPVVDAANSHHRTKGEDGMADDRERNQGMKQGTGEGTGQHAPGRNPQDNRAAGGKQGGQQGGQQPGGGSEQGGIHRKGGGNKEGGQNEQTRR
jgi:hypothetical protein